MIMVGLSPTRSFVLMDSNSGAATDNQSFGLTPCSITTPGMQTRGGCEAHERFPHTL